MTSEAAKAIVLQTEAKEHIGFTLFHPDIAAPSGDCVFMVAPKKPELLETQEVLILSKIKEDGEHQWEWREKDLLILISDKEILKYRNDGSVFYIPSGDKLGLWFPAK